MIIWLFLLPFVFCDLEGQVSFVNDYPPSPTVSTEIIVLIYSNDVEGDSPIPLSQTDIYYGKSPYYKSICDEKGSFQIPLATGFYTIFAFQDVNNNSRWDINLFEPCGWYGGPPRRWAVPVYVDSSQVVNVNFNLYSIEPLPKEPSTKCGGKLQQIKGYTVVNLNGKPEDRGFAHGCLLGPYIIQFFRRYVLEETTMSDEFYLNTMVPYYTNSYNYTKDYLNEIDAVIAGMIETGINMTIPELGRKFERVDLLYLNDFGTYPQTANMGRRLGCSQFAFWGPATQQGELQGGTIIGRNMDGETDLRKATLAFFLLYAVNPVEGSSYVSMAWPGFVGVPSGLSSNGMHVMLNYGSSHWKGGEATNVSPAPWVVKQILMHASNFGTSQEIVQQYKGSLGGTCPHGCNMFMGLPTNDQGLSAAVVYEGDRLGGALRQPGSAAPLWPYTLMATNHFYNYGYDSTSPQENFGQPISFSSLWRYEAGKRTTEAWLSYNMPIGTLEMQRLLQTVTEGITVHSIITYPNKKSFAVAVADIKPLGWHAPYLSWTTFQWQDLFP